MNTALLKIELLLWGIQIDFESLQNFKYKTDKHQHNLRHYTDNEKVQRIPQEILIYAKEQNRWLCVGILLRPESPYTLKCINNNPVLLYQNNIINFQVKFLDEPRVWGNLTSDNVPMDKLISLPGKNELNLWTWHDCGFQLDGMGCAFCTTTRTSNKMGSGYSSELLSAQKIRELSRNELLESHYQCFLKRAVEALRTSLKLDFENDKYWLTIIGGSLSLNQLDDNALFVTKLLNDLFVEIPDIDKDHSVCNIMPPNSLALIDEIKKTGVRFYMMNMEIWDEELFQKICPGKSIYGRVKFIDALDYTVKIFGYSNVWCNFVCGLEPLDKQITGFKYLAEMGVVPGANIFHKDPYVSANWAPNIDVSTIAKFYVNAAEILHKNKLEPFYSLESRRSSLMWEAFLGIL